MCVWLPCDISRSMEFIDLQSEIAPAEHRTVRSICEPYRLVSALLHVHIPFSAMADEDKRFGRAHPYCEPGLVIGHRLLDRADIPLYSSLPYRTLANLQ